MLMILRSNQLLVVKFFCPSSWDIECLSGINLHLIFVLWTGCATLCFLPAKWAVQIWGIMQIWSSSDNEIQPFSFFSHRYASCSIPSWVFTSYSSPILLIIRAEAWIYFRIQNGSPFNQNALFWKRLKQFSWFDFLSDWTSCIFWCPTVRPECCPFKQ